MMAPMHELLWRGVCQLIMTLNLIEIGSTSSSDASTSATRSMEGGVGNMIGLTLFNTDAPACHHMFAYNQHMHGSSSHNAANWKSSHPSGSSNHLSSSPLNELDAFTWFKLLFIPTLGILILICFLLEDYCFANPHHHHPHAHLHPHLLQSHPPSTILGWIRHVFSRGPKLTTAYQNQLKQNAAALAMQQQHALHTHGNGSTCPCGGSSSSPTFGAHDAHLSGNSPYSSIPLSLNINFNGFNHMSGPLQYYHTFQRDESELTLDAEPTKSGAKNSVHSNGKHSTNTTSPSSKKKDSAFDKSPSSPNSRSPSSPTSSSSSPPASPSSSIGIPPPSEFMPLTLHNEQTGFHQTFSLWRGLTFGEILGFYVQEYWTEEQQRYEGYEGTFNNGGDQDDENAAEDSSKGNKGKKKDSTEAGLGDKSNESPTQPLMFRYQGTRISSLLTPASVFPPTTNSNTTSSKDESPPALEICIDYFYLFDRLRLKSNSHIHHQHQSLHSTKTMQKSLLDEISKTEMEIETQGKHKKEVEDKIMTLSNNELKKLNKEIEKIQKELNNIQASKTEIETSLSLTNAAGSTTTPTVGLITSQRQNLTKEYESLQLEHESKQVAFNAAKETYANLMNERHEYSNELKQLMISYDGLMKKLNQFKIHKVKHDKVIEKIKKLEQVLGMGTGSGSANQSQAQSSQSNSTASASSTANNTNTDSTATTTDSSKPTATTAPSDSSSPPSNAATLLRQKYSQLELEHNILNAQLNELRLSSHEIDDLSKNESYKLRYRLKLLEKDARDLSKWKSIARTHESEARDCIKWKIQLKQYKMRERMLEKEMKERNHWGMRSKMMEREVRELRNWKRQMESSNVVAAAAAGEDSFSIIQPLATATLPTVSNGLMHSHPAEVDALFSTFGSSNGSVSMRRGAGSSASIIPGARVIHKISNASTTDEEFVDRAFELDTNDTNIGHGASSNPNFSNFGYDQTPMSSTWNFNSTSIPSTSNSLNMAFQYDSNNTGASLVTRSPTNANRLMGGDGQQLGVDEFGMDVAAGAEPEFTHLPAFLSE